ncbi:MAG: hypothetical protein IPP13_12010 [Kouleothrix sp.]|jgi:hypothetical protein|nr:hypothetical protein [Kouleothrix sp.]
MYRSYLLRCWENGEQGIVERFVVERISDAPRHWVFGSFADLMHFMRSELLGEQPGRQPENSPPDDIDCATDDI